MMRVRGHSRLRIFAMWSKVSKLSISPIFTKRGENLRASVSTCREMSSAGSQRVPKYSSWFWNVTAEAAPRP